LSAVWKEMSSRGIVVVEVGVVGVMFLCSRGVGGYTQFLSSCFRAVNIYIFYRASQGSPATSDGRSLISADDIFWVTMEYTGTVNGTEYNADCQCWPMVSVVSFMHPAWLLPEVSYMHFYSWNVSFRQNGSETWYTTLGFMLWPT